MVPALRNGVLCLLFAALSAALDLSAKVQGRAQAEQAPIEGQPEQEGPEPELSPDEGQGFSEIMELPEEDAKASMKAAQTRLTYAVHNSRWGQVAEACDNINTLMLSNHMFVAGLITDGTHKVAITQMGKHPTEKALQLNCFKLLVSMGAYSQQAAHAISSVAIKPVFYAVSTYGPTEPWMIASVGLLQDNCYWAKKAMQDEGFTEMVQVISDTHASEQMELAAQCFFSTVCGPKSLTDHLRSLDYIKRSMSALGRYSLRDASHTTIRGQILANLAGCFLREKADLALMVDNGIITQVLNAVDDEGGGEVDAMVVDQVGPTHLYTNAMDIVSALARTNDTWRLKLIKEGALKTIGKMMDLVHKGGGALQFSAKDSPATKCPSSLNLGHPPTAISRTCTALSALVPDPAQLSKVSKDIFRMTVDMMQTNLVQYDPDLLTACSGLLTAMQVHRRLLSRLRH